MTAHTFHSPENGRLLLDGNRGLISGVTITAIADGTGGVPAVSVVFYEPLIWPIVRALIGSMWAGGDDYKALEAFVAERRRDEDERMARWNATARA
jgi:hypothetical protein